MTRTALMLRAMFCLACAAAAGRCAAAIPVSGIADKKVYADRAVFTVSSEEGYEYTQLSLTSEPVATDLPVLLDQPVRVTYPQYYELNVRRRPAGPGAEESARIRFIVRSSERKNAEWGLPPWTPYPLINSAAAEFAGGRLTIVAPAAYPRDMEIPVIALVRTAEGKRVGVNGPVAAAAYPGRAIQLLRGQGSAFLPAAGAAGTIAYDASVQTLAAAARIAIDAATTWQTAPAVIGAPATWPRNARVSVDSDLTIDAGAALAIEAGAVVRLGPGVEIFVNGELTVNGTYEEPVVFAPADRAAPWGGLVFKGGASRGAITGAIMTASGADPDWFHNNPGSGATHLDNECLFYLSGGARVAFTDCWLIDHRGQAGHGESSYLTMTRCLVQKFLTFGEYNGGEVRLDDSALIEFPDKDAPFADNDSDGVYLTGGNHRIADCVIGFLHDDGVDAGSGAGGPVEITRCWIEACYHEALAWSCSSGTRLPIVTDTVIINCGQGIEAGWGNPRVEADRCLCVGNGVGARFGDNYDWSYNGFLRVTNSLLLHNLRDVWGRAWDTWEEHPLQMEVSQNLLTAADPRHPANGVWDPGADAERLAPFLPAPDDAVGIGIAAGAARLEASRIGAGVPVALSTFSRKTVAVDYEAASDAGILATGTLRFEPGRTVRFLPIDAAEIQDQGSLRVTLRNPVHAELSDRRELLIVPDAWATIIPAGSVWKYWDKNVDQGTAWREPAFDDSAWASGPAELGYGDGDEATVIDGGPSNNRNPTAYFRREFRIEDPSRFLALRIGLKRDDGAVVYLNGTEVFRSNMPAGTIGYKTWASSSGTSESTFFTQEAEASLLAAGENLIACEVHQANATSSDLSFDLTLQAERAAAPPAPSFIRGDANGDGRIDLSDAVTILRFLFAAAPTDCGDALDANDSGRVDVADAVYVLAYLFGAGPPPPAPFPRHGPDPTADDLACERR
ncbi:MAG TPA: dockerin type I repeat-containing protein [Planctomycetota bacterium]|nr:dockerin type I repeat-containing protein [Planctomycetota bacterium]HNR98169.1 dockerin type I repeat-containing protein [Planctomycetota bacterium]HNU27364.1 dockerin type I repeat-containing protein [Planctomycetota bacterium]HOE86209.1 dockerin type I repeat-containing protein [Planctomycetota bacterium]HOR67105.1 dockerin type I repeat-containing protein [Planctomycetota bacterium]